MPEKNIDFGKFGARGIRGTTPSPASSTGSPATSSPR